MPTTVTSSIGTSSRDYSTLQAWEDAAPANLVTADQIWRGECYNDSEFSAGNVLTVSGSITDSTRYKELTTAVGQSFSDNANVQTNALRYNQSNGVGMYGSGAYNQAVIVTESYFRISKVQIRGAPSNSFIFDSSSSNTGIIIDKCIVENSGFAGLVARLRGAIATNCLFVHRANNGSGVSFDYWTGGALAVNCTVVRPSDKTVSGVGWLTSSSGITLKNCTSFGFTNEVDAPANYTAIACRTDKASPMTGFTTVAYDTSTGSGFQDTTDSTRDFRIKSTSAMIDVGTTDATNAPIDIAGTSRPVGSAYDVGCWEYVSAGGGSFKAGKPTVIGQAIGGMY